MQDIEKLSEVLSALEAAELFRATRRIDGSEINGAAALEGELLIGGREVTLQLVLDSSFPLTLPRFFLRPWDALGFIPHVDQRGFVCFADPEGLIMNRRQPIQIVHEAFQRVVHVLTDGVTERNIADFADEFESYWNQLPGLIQLFSVLNPTDEVAEVIIAMGKDKWIVESKEHDISAFNNGACANGALTIQKAIYLPLEPGTIIIPPRPNGSFWTAEEARLALLSCLSEANSIRLQKLLRRRTRIREYVIVKLPCPRGGTTLFGIRYEAIGKQHPLLKKGTAERLVPLQLQRRDQSYLVGRGGGDTALGTKRVLLAGCGAVGGHLAFELAHAGVLNLTLVDHDILIPENSFRHALGRPYWDQKKVKALKHEIELHLPYVQITAVADTIEGALANGSVNLTDYDLLVLALGNPTVELEINERVHRLGNRSAIVFTWLEPLGIGGHALLANNALSGGCFECLYTSAEDEEEVLENRAAFAAQGQSFGRALSGCGSLYTPYSSIDAKKTASLAARLVVDALAGKELGNPLLSWKGDATAFEAEGFRFSPRYTATADELFRHRYTYKSTQCRICSVRVEGNE